MVILLALTVGTFFNVFLLAYALVAFFWWPLFIQGPHESAIWTVPIALGMAWASPFVIIGSTILAWYLYNRGRTSESVFAMYAWMFVYLFLYGLFF